MLGWLLLAVEGIVAEITHDRLMVVGPFGEVDARQDSTSARYARIAAKREES